MAHRSKNLWAPWRMDYIRSLGDGLTDDGCFICRYWKDPDQDAKNRVLWRTPSSLVVMNLFPYTNGHLLVCHGYHKAELGELSDEELTDLTGAVRDGVAVLRAALSPHGFNLGINLGRCAGAGLPGHLHAHIVPRWSGDTNFMTVVGDSRVVPDALDATYQQLDKSVTALGLR
jgi:ATP adenylyltransferase